MAKRGRPEIPPGEMGTVSLKPHKTEAGVWWARVTYNDWNNNKAEVGPRKSPPQFDSRGRPVPDRNGERARRLVIDAAQEAIDESRGPTEGITAKSPLTEVWTAYKGDLKDHGRQELTIYGTYEPLMVDLAPKWGRREIGTFSTPVVEAMLKHLGERRGPSAPVAGKVVLSGLFHFAVHLGAYNGENPGAAARIPTDFPARRRTGGAVFPKTEVIGRVYDAVRNSTLPCPARTRLEVTTTRKWVPPTVAEYCSEDQQDLADWVVLSMGTGLRISQSMGLRDSDFDLTPQLNAPHGTVRPTGAIKKRRAPDSDARVWLWRWEDSTPKRSAARSDPKNKQQTIALEPWVHDMVEARLKRLRLRRLAFPPRLADADWPEDLFFPQPLRRRPQQRALAAQRPRTHPQEGYYPPGGPRNLNVVNSSWNRVASALAPLAVATGFTSHSFRKWVLNETRVKFGPEVAADIGGHGGAEMIRQHYSADRNPIHPGMVGHLSSVLAPHTDNVRSI